MAKEYMVVSIIGPDKRGIVAKITDVITSHSGNIEESRMARLGGEFAAIMLISLLAESKSELTTGLSALEKDGFIILVRPTDLSRLKVFEGFVPYEISVIGADHEGIVHRVAEYLAEENIQVESMETHITRAPVTGTPLFSMYTTIQAPPDVTLQQLRDKLSDISDLLSVDIEVRLP